MNSPPLISVIIPTYNRAGLIAETLESVVAQEYSNWECIVVDDGSTDETGTVVKGFINKDARIKFFKRPTHLIKGANSCRNFGFTQSSGEYINWFDDDDIMQPDFLSYKMNNAEGRAIVISSALIVDEQKKPIQQFRFDNIKPLYKQYALTKTEMVTNSVLFKRSFLEDKILFDPKICRGQEAEFFLRIFRDVPDTDFFNSDHIGFLYRQHGQSKTTKAKKYVKKYRESQAYIFVSNLVYTKERNNKELMNANYKMLIGYLFESCEQRHIKNYRYIMGAFHRVLFSIAPFLILKLTVTTLFLLLIGRNSYTLRQKFKKIKL